MTTMSISLDISDAKLHLHLSYENFFSAYDPFVDGKVYIATYSFNHKQFQFWSKLQPLSCIYLAPKYHHAAISFLRRFPLFEVREVPKLHTKAVFFEKSRKLLIGSENLYAPYSEFSEAMIEVTVPEAKQEDIVRRVFLNLGGTVLTTLFRAADIRLHPDGWPYLPCQEEVSFWSLVARVVTFVPGVGLRPPEKETTTAGIVYFLLEYNVDGVRHFLAFNRGYAYCGDLDEDAYTWLTTHCSIDARCDAQSVFLSSAQDLRDTSPNKDRFMTYHPIASRYRAVGGVYLGPVKNISKHARRVVKPPVHDISDRKIRSRRPRSTGA